MDGGLEDRLDELAGRHGVPGAVVGVLADGEVELAATGVINRRTGVTTTIETLFQIGSITKLFTATAISQLVAEGSLDLDDPVRRHLPEFRVADPDVSERVTIRHLLCHTSGIAGDLFVDTGRGDECVERHVAECAGLEQVHELGATMSYCNSGYVVLDRVLEVLDGTIWDRVMRRRLFEPLGLERTVTLPEQALLHRTAVGHPGGQVTRLWDLPRATGPAGCISASAEDVLAFAAMHLADESLRWMQEPQIELPDHSFGDHWAHGWVVMDWPGGRVVGHDGATVGQNAFLRVVPDAGVAVVLLTNGGAPRLLYQDLFEPLLAERAGVALRRLPEPPAVPAPVDTSLYAGVWRSLIVSYDLQPDGEVLRGVREGIGPGANFTPRRPVVATPVDDSLFVVVAEDEPTPIAGVFYDRDADGRPSLLHLGARALTRAGDP